MTFQDLKITRQYLNALEDLGIEHPTPIQQKAIPAIRSGQHVIGIAQTGTGKTAAYLLPILHKIKYAQGSVPRCVILVPTKELVVQVSNQIAELSKYTDIRHKGIYGGVGPKAQAAVIKQGVDIVIATPRRLLEFCEREDLSLKNLQMLVLDEADRMMDMGFMHQINMILDVAPRKKQNLLFSATFSARVEELSWNFMDFPTKIEITPEATPVETVEQISYKTPNIQTKLNLIRHILQNEEEYNRVIVFVKTKKTATQIYDHLRRKTEGKIRLIHSNKGQNTRINAFKDFKEGDVRILVATDVMARGIDIPEVSHVINFDVPVQSEDYVHRIGRTGRAFCTGSAITFITEADFLSVERIEKKIRMSIPVSELPEEVEITETPFEEKQALARAIDAQKRKADPTYQGAFHEKKNHKTKQRNKKQKKTPKFTGKANTFYQKTGPKKKTTSKRHRNKKK
ncbi:MAG: DEAD/DEAH box helicase [Aureispira sp.]|nr:DEAD/DEAH box helicase [Aureispira sp.]